MKKNSSYKKHHFAPRTGFTLVEVLVAIGIFSIIVVIATGGFVRAIRTQRQVASLISAQSNVSLVLEQMAREVRTGYLFCHDPNVNNPSSLCDDELGQVCQVTASPDGPTWTCGALDFYDSSGVHVNYSLLNGSLRKSEGGGQSESVTGDQVFVKYLTFKLFGMTEGDNWTPRVTIAVGITPSSSDVGVMNDVLNLETSVSARAIDCTSSGGTPLC